MNSSARTMSNPAAIAVVSLIFFTWGGLTSLNDVLIPHLKAVFSMNYAQTMLIQFTFFGAYFLMSMPAGAVVARVGYKAGIVIGLVIASIGAAMFYPAARLPSYPVFLTALFVLASGITLLQVAANPYISLLGRPETSHSRLNLAQALNSLGTTVFPLLIGPLILVGAVLGVDEIAAMGAAEQAAYRAAEARSVEMPYLLLAGGLLLLAVAAWIVAMVLSRKLVRPILNMYPSEVSLRQAREARDRGESIRPMDASAAIHTGAPRDDADDDLLLAPAVSPYRELDPLTQRINNQHARLVHQMDQLRDADLMRSEFTANVTHELKTPLQSIQGASELMMEGLVKPEDVEDFSRRIYKEARRLSNLVNDILMLSKLDDTERNGIDSARANSEPVDLFAVTHDVEQRLGPKADDAEVELTLDGSRAVVMGMPRLIDELISNLIVNAIRYNHPGGYVRVWVGHVAGRPTVRVSDTGIGIAPADQQKIFERFYRVEKSRSRASGGTGLGLAIVKHAAAFHHASVDVQSQLGHGSTFTITFPPLPAD